MKITPWLLILPVAVLLSGGSLEAKNKPKSSKNHGTEKTTEVAMKKSTEGHRPQDLNGDGIIQRHEWPGNDTSFRELDTDGDGVLTKKDRAYTENGGKSMYDRPVNDYKTGKRK
jgi:hypothetical protein